MELEKVKRANPQISKLVLLAIIAALIIAAKQPKYSNALSFIVICFVVICCNSKTHEQQSSTHEHKSNTTLTEASQRHYLLHVEFHHQLDYSFFGYFTKFYPSHCQGRDEHQYARSQNHNSQIHSVPLFPIFASPHEKIFCAYNGH